MAFSVHLDPHHVQHPTHGWLTAAHLSDDPGLAGRIYPAGAAGGRLRSRGGAPEATHPHHVEVDCSTGLVGYTRLEPDEIAELERDAAEKAVADQERTMAERARLKALRAHAAENPAFAALLEHLGVRTE